jgi:AcrR family transcriptional regulator
MPRISASTVAEHRERQRTALLDAARAILASEGIGGLHFAAVASEAGLARTSVYEYFDSRAGLVAAVLDREFPAFVEGLAAAVTSARTPRTRLKAFVEHQLETMAEGTHRLLAEASRVELPESSRQLIRDLHVELTGLLLGTLRDLGVRRPELVAGYVQAVVNEATAQIERGADPSGVIPAACRFVLDATGA